MYKGSFFNFQDNRKRKYFPLVVVIRRNEQQEQRLHRVRHICCGSNYKDSLVDLRS